MQFLPHSIAGSAAVKFQPQFITPFKGLDFFE
jgi:hypothetical protein